MSEFSVKKPFTVLVGIILIIILGVMSYTNMTADLLPEIDLPYMVVSTTYIGATPEEVETKVTKPLEQTLGTVTNLESLNSISSENYSMIMLEFAEGTNMDSTLVDLNNKLALVKETLNDDMIGTPTITKIDMNSLPIIIAAIDIEGLETKDLTEYVNKNIINDLEKIEGVASVTGMGLVESEIAIQLNQDKIDDLNEEITDNLDAKFLKSEAQISDAKSKVAQGKTELANARKTQTSKIENGIVQISNGKEMLGEQIEFLSDKETQLSTTVNTIQMILNILDGNENVDVLETIIRYGASLQLDVDKLRQLGSDLKTNVVKQLNDMLTDSSSGLTQLQTQKTALETEYEKLETQEKTVLLAKSELETELANAERELLATESQLNTASRELAVAKEAAYKSASLDGVITQDMISSILAAQNFSMPAGYIQADDNNIIVKVGEKISSLDEIKNLTLFSLEFEGLENITLEDVADIAITDNSSEMYAKINGNNGIVLSLQKENIASTKTVADNIKEKFSQIEENSETEIKFTVLLDQGIYIDLIVDSVLQNLLYGAILAIIILFVFLKDYRPTLAVALSIPISLTFAIALMYFTGVTINIISLSGLALSVGMLVDNSIVVIENIYRLKSEGLSTKEASIKGAKSVAGAIVSSTLTTICVFLPIVFIEGITRELFVDMALTIAYSLIASLIVALTVVPTITSKLFKNVPIKKDVVFNKLINVYEKLLNKALNHKAIVLTGSLVLLIVSVLLINLMGTAFIPEMEGTQMTVSLTFNEEITEVEANNYSDEIVEKLLEIEDIETVGALRGASMLSTSEENTISMYLILNEKRTLNNIEMEKAISARVEGYPCEATINTSTMDMSALAGSGLEIIIRGDNLQGLQEVALEIEEILNSVEGISEVDNGIGKTSDELMVTINKNDAMLNGLTVAQVYQTLADKLSGDKTATTVTIDNKEYPIVVVKTEEQTLTEEDLEDFVLTGTKNNEEVEVSLSDIAQIKYQESMNSIYRESAERYITVTALVDSEHNINHIDRKFKELLEDYEVPEGFEIEVAGENQTINEALADLLLMVGIAIIFIYLIMVAQFQSFRAPFIVMFTIPLAFTGGLIALFITGQKLSVIAMLGFLVLSGIIVNNGIVLIDYINQLIATGMSKKEAIILAGKTRLRPIFMTALTTILGMLTLSLGVGMGADMIQGLGIVVIGGLIYSTLLTLLVVPCMYDICYRKVVDKTPENSI